MLSFGVDYVFIPLEAETMTTMPNNSPESAVVGLVHAARKVWFSFLHRTTRVFVIILLFAVSGCAHRELLSGEQAEATSQVQRWVPVGTPVADAIRIMERHGFTCMVVDHGTTYLECDYRSSGSISNPVLVCGHASFPVTDGKVLAAQVRTYLKGP